MARFLLLVFALLLVGCGGRRDERRAGPPPPPPAPRAQAFQACTSDLLAVGVRFRALPDREFGGGCSATGAVQLLDIGTPVTQLGAMRCGLAERFAGWVRDGAGPAALRALGSALVRVESFGTYACRGTIGTARTGSGPPRLSGHAIANAVDIAAFVLADGRRITVLAGWSSPDPAVRGFLRAVRGDACRRFGTVLSPDYNAAHANHLHFEDDAASFCR